MFLGVLNAVFLNISNYPSHLELRIHTIQIVVTTSSVMKQNVGIKRVDCTSQVQSSRQISLSAEINYT